MSQHLDIDVQELLQFFYSAKLCRRIVKVNLVTVASESKELTHASCPYKTLYVCKSPRLFQVKLILCFSVTSI